MATQYDIPEELTGNWVKAKDWLAQMLTEILDPNRQTAPPGMYGVTPPVGIGSLIAGNIMPDTPKSAYESGIMGMGPMPAELAANYRSPEVIQKLRKAMAEENRARGPIAQQNKGDLVWHRNNSEALAPTSTTNGPIYDIPEVLPYKEPDPIDQILRGSWFHGMRDEARNVVINRNQTAGNPALAANNYAEYPLAAVNEHGLPGSTHAHPGYVRFGEPYGVSLTASPSVAASGFSPDQMIHRVQPLYGGPPTQTIIPMWRPEGVAAMNEGYNTAFNKWLNQTDLPVTKTMAEYISYQMSPQGNANNYGSVSNILNDWANLALKYQTSAAEFNTLYSKALQDKGYRGILYSPQRYGEYEMLMLDPSYVRPLDYRSVLDYTTAKAMRKNAEAIGVSNIPTRELVMTPQALKGYTTAQPEFQTGTTRLGDVFNQVPWKDRLSEENKRRITELVDSKYRELIAKQLFD